MITTSTKNENFIPEKARKENAIIGSHCYCLMNAFSLARKDGSIVEILALRNPWGHIELDSDWNDSKTWG